MRSILLAALVACAASPPAAPPTDAATAAPSAARLADLDLTRLDGAPIEADQLNGKVVLVVNVASRCGFTPQYAGLEQLHDTYGARGLQVVGVPCNQFGGQEPGDAEQIATFCEKNYGVSFTMLEKQDVNGKDRSPLYGFLVDSPVGKGQRVQWNFEKFLVGRDGQVIGRWGSRTTPSDPALIAAIEQALGPA